MPLEISIKPHEIGTLRVAPCAREALVACLISAIAVLRKVGSAHLTKYALLMPLLLLLTHLRDTLLAASIRAHGARHERGPGTAVRISYDSIERQHWLQQRFCIPLSKLLSVSLTGDLRFELRQCYFIGDGVEPQLDRHADMQLVGRYARDPGCESRSFI